MRLWKKVSAMVAMAAVCMTMAVPVVASAEVDARVGGCAVHNWQPGMDELVLSVERHAYEVGLCVRTEKDVITYEYCNDCGHKKDVVITRVITHSECGAVE